MSRTVADPASLARETLAARFAATRAATETLVAPLTPEDCAIQSMPDASPTRWHLAHTTWFFETFVLAEAIRGYRCIDPSFATLFNSYYHSIGPQFPRAQRGLLSRPTLGEVIDYRAQVTASVLALLQSGGLEEEWVRRIELGCQHEQQHQELILTDILHVFAQNPLRPAYREEPWESAPYAITPLTWHPVPEGLHRIGATHQAFAFDNERPRHQIFLQPAWLADRLVTSGEYLDFVRDGGYRTPQLWLSLGWEHVIANNWQAPLYWEEHEGVWFEFTLRGLRPLDLVSPVRHVSYFEADAFARWAGARLPREAEWELLAAPLPTEGNFVESGALLPLPAAGSRTPSPRQLFGDAWEWTASPYVAYPGYQSDPGALGEYNGKFMCNQYVLRGGSCGTPASHIRATYRNFFPPEARWQFSGIRLAKDAP